MPSLAKLRDVAWTFAALAVFALAIVASLYLWSLRQTHIRIENEATETKRQEQEKQAKIDAAEKQGLEDCIDVFYQWGIWKQLAELCREHNDEKNAEAIEAELTYEQSLLQPFLDRMNGDKNESKVFWTTARTYLDKSRKDRGVKIPTTQKMPTTGQ